MSGASNDTLAAVAALFAQMAPQFPHLLQEPPEAWKTEEKAALLQLIKTRFKPDATFAWLYQWYLLSWQTEMTRTGNFITEDVCTNNLLTYLQQNYQPSTTQVSDQQTTSTQQVNTPLETVTSLGVGLGSGNREESEQVKLY